MEKIIIVAISDDNAIGKENGLLWDMPADFEYFMSVIKGHWLISGRKSYESDQGDEVFSDPSKTIVLTRQSDYDGGGAKVVHDIESAFQVAKKAGAEKAFVLGGGAVYKQSIPLVDTLLITEIHAEFEGADTFFPKFDKSQWIEMARDEHKKDERNPYDYAFVQYERKTKLIDHA